MIFHVIERNQNIPTATANAAYLSIDNWNDFGHQTSFYLAIFMNDGNRVNVGEVKIGQFGIPQDEVAHTIRSIPKTFDTLDETYFSLGQSENYYEMLNELPQNLKQQLLEGLRDCAWNLDIFNSALNEDVMKTSLLRFGTSYRNQEVVQGRFHRVAHGDAALTSYNFEYTYPIFSEDIIPPKLIFDVVPESNPPTNVHVIIGRNGVGKTRLMENVIQALNNKVGKEQTNPGTLEFLKDDDGSEFSSIVKVSFSAFDESDSQDEGINKIPVNIVGLTFSEKTNLFLNN